MIVIVLHAGRTVHSGVSFGREIGTTSRTSWVDGRVLISLSSMVVKLASCSEGSSLVPNGSRTSVHDCSHRGLSGSATAPSIPRRRHEEQEATANPGTLPPMRLQPRKVCQIITNARSAGSRISRRSFRVFRQQRYFWLYAWGAAIIGLCYVGGSWALRKENGRRLKCWYSRAGSR